MAGPELRQGETLVEKITGDYWQKVILFFYLQKAGSFWLTNQRIIFKGGIVASLEIELNEIDSISTCSVGGLIPMIPTGIRVLMKDGKVYKLSVLSRKKHMEQIQELIH